MNASSSIQNNSINIVAGQYTSRGHKNVNEDALGLRIPEADAQRTKGIVAAIADGVSAADFGREAAEACVLGFLNDYFATPSLWTVAHSAQKVLESLNRWLCRQSFTGMQDNSYLCTFSSLILRGRTGHIFHVGDSRIWRYRNQKMEQLTRDHTRRVGGQQEFLTRAMGLEHRVDVDYQKEPLQEGDLFLITTDGIHDFLDIHQIERIICKYKHDPDQACKLLTEQALACGSDDNLSCQLLFIQTLPESSLPDTVSSLGALPFPPVLKPGMQLDGLEVIREIHASSRSQLYVVRETSSGEHFVMKTPSVNYLDDQGYIKRFSQEAWLGSKLRSPNIVKVIQRHGMAGTPSCLYYLMEMVDGITLEQWLQEHPRPPLQEVLFLLDQLLNAVRSMHRNDIIHQDIKPANIMVDRHGIIKLIDLGSCHLRSIQAVQEHTEIPLGTRHYTAPEVRNGVRPCEQSDLYSCAVLLYFMLTGKLPDTEPHKEASELNHFVPDWLDAVIQKGLRENPMDRYTDAAEFRHALTHPGFVEIKKRSVLAERHWVIWPLTSLVLAILLIISLVLHIR